MESCVVTEMSKTQTYRVGGGSLIKKQKQKIPICTHSDDIYKTEYELKTNLFDPSKASPTNEFMIKLYRRFHE